MSCRRRPNYAVRVTYATGVEHVEGGSDTLAMAEQFARLAIEDYCLKAEVVSIAARGTPTGAVLSVWNEERLLAERLGLPSSPTMKLPGAAAAG